MKVWIAIDLRKDQPPRIIGVYERKKDAEIACSAPGITWGNVIEQKVVTAT